MKLRSRRPKETTHSRHPGVRTGNELTFGERAADRMRNVMGTWTFIGGFFFFMICWAAANSIFFLAGKHGKHGFDPYPYVLLNLFLSMLAGVQGAALLIAAKRSDAVSSEIAVHTLENTQSDTKLLEENTNLTREVARLLKENTRLTKVAKGNTDAIEEVHRHVTALTEHFHLRAGEKPAAPPRRRRDRGAD